MKRALMSEISKLEIEIELTGEQKIFNSLYCWKKLKNIK